jgi:hypothetical protein
MTEQVCGVFNDVENAERAYSALKDHGADGNEISVVRRSTGAGVPEINEHASTGLTTTSGADAAEGAVKGGAIGLAVGILAGAAMLTIPGVGVILAAGPLAGAIGAALATGAAGAAAGGAVGYLVDQGVPEDAANRYANALNRGDILLSVRSPKLTEGEAQLVLDKYGAIEIFSFPVGSPVEGVAEPPIVDTAADIREGIPPAPAAVPVTPPDLPRIVRR